MRRKSARLMAAFTVGALLIAACSDDEKTDATPATRCDGKQDHARRPHAAQTDAGSA